VAVSEAREHDFWIHLHGERGVFWERVLGTAVLPIRSPWPTPARLPDRAPGLVFLLAADLMSPAQLEAIHAAIAERFGLPVDEVRAEAARDGYPILGEEATVVIHRPQRWLG
jgi:hypothetical protein